MIPLTNQIRARPVWSRYLRRLELAQSLVLAGAPLPRLDPPTDEEKADAIEVLRDAPEWIDAISDDMLFPETVPITKALIAEAERIFLEASVVGEAA